MFKRFHSDYQGSVLVEATVMMTIIFTFILGGIDFLFAFYQYNSAAKAVEIGARIAAVWDPVANGLDNLSTAVVSSTTTVGTDMPSFKVTCDGAKATCTCDSGTCTGVSGYSTAAMNTLVYGRGNTGTCNAGGSYYTLGMCGIYAPIKPANVIVTYSHVHSSTNTGPGYVGRPGGPVPTITVSLQNMPFKFYFLGGLLGFADILMPPLTTSITGEYMSSGAPS